MLNSLTNGLDFQAKALTMRADRQRLIASNIANADTPGYVAKDMNFSQALLAATGGGNPAATLATSNASHLGGSTGSTGEGSLDYALQSQPTLDQNSVDMDRERASFADNAVHYEATLRFINNSVKTTLSAITGQ